MDGYKLCDKIQDLTPLQIHFTALVFKEKIQIVASALGASPAPASPPVQPKPQALKKIEVPPGFSGPLYLHRSKTDITGRRPETKVYTVKEYVEMRKRQWGFEMQPLGKVAPQNEKQDEGSIIK